MANNYSSAYSNNRESVWSVCVSINDTEMRLIQDTHNGSCRKRYLQTSLMLEKLHLQVLSHGQHVTGTTVF